MKPKRYKPEFAVQAWVEDESRRFVPPDLDTLPIAAQASGQGGAPTITVAPFDASDLSKSKADEFLTGVGDEALLQDISNQYAGTGYLLWLTEGTINFSPGGLWTVSGPATVMGAGKGATFIIGDNDLGSIVGLGEDGTISNLFLENVNADPNAIALELTGDSATVDNVKAFSGGAAIVMDGDEGLVRRVAVNGGTHGILDSGSLNSITDAFVESSGVGVSVQGNVTNVRGCRALGCGSHGLEVLTNGATVLGNYVEGSSQSSANTFDNYHIDGDENEVHSNYSLPSAAVRYGLNIAGGSNNNPFANYLGDASAYGTADFVDGGTGTMTSPGANGQFAF